MSVFVITQNVLYEYPRWPYRGICSKNCSSLFIICTVFVLLSHRRICDTPQYIFPKALIVILMDARHKRNNVFHYGLSPQLHQERKSQTPRHPQFCSLLYKEGHTTVSFLCYPFEIFVTLTGCFGLQCLFLGPICTYRLVDPDLTHTRKYFVLSIHCQFYLSLRWFISYPLTV